MLQASLLTDHHFPLDKHQLILVGGDGATWIKEGAKDYFPNSLYQLCPFDLERRLTQTLSCNSMRYYEISQLLKQSKIPEALTILEDRERYPKKTKELEELATYFINNQEGINTVDVLKEKGLPVDTMGAIKGNIDKVLSNRFKKGV